MQGDHSTTRKSPTSHGTVLALTSFTDVARPSSGRVSVSRAVQCPCGFCFFAAWPSARRIEGLAMAGKVKSWPGQYGKYGRSHLATQAVVLLPVMAIAGLSAWTIGSSAKGQSVAARLPVLAAITSQLAPAPAVVEANQQSAPPAGAPPDAAASPTGTPALNGLKISSQSWRRGGLGSNALVTFTLRNNNDYAVKDIEIACAFSRRDGSHLTERKRVIPDAVVDMRSRRTFARMHVGFVNINATTAKCALVAASRV